MPQDTWILADPAEAVKTSVDRLKRFDFFSPQIYKYASYLAKAQKCKD